MRTLIPLLALAAACGDGKAVPDAPKPPIDGPPDAMADTQDDRRGPKTMPLTGGANSLLWDDATSTLFLTDNNANTLLKYTDAKGIETVGTWPASAMISLGDMVARPGGAILLANFGFGTAGSIFKMQPDHTSVNLTGLD